MKNLILVCEAKLIAKSLDESESNSGKIEARVTTWGAREGADGRKFNYQPMGFSQWADEFAKAGKPLPMFLNHNDSGMPVGQWNEFNFDEDGMTASGSLFMNTTAGSDLYTVLKESPNLFGGVSVGAYADECQYVTAEGAPFDPAKMGEDEAYFQITKGGLQEVSVVMYPNNPNAEIQKLEYFDAEGQPNPRHIEKGLRDAGLSRKDAVVASSVLKKMLEKRDADKPLIENSAPTQSDPEAVVIEAEKEILNALEQRELLALLSNRLIKESQCPKKSSKS